MLAGLEIPGDGERDLAVLGETRTVQLEKSGCAGVHGEGFWR